MHNGQSSSPLEAGTAVRICQGLYFIRAITMQYNEIHRYYFGNTSSEHKLGIKEFDDEESYFGINLF